MTESDLIARGRRRGERRGTPGMRRVAGTEPSPWLVWPSRIAILAGILGGWAYLSSSSDHWHGVLSSPDEVLEQLRLWSTDGAFYADHVWVTFLEAALGYLFGVAFAMGLVVLVASSKTLERLLMPFITVLAVLPKLALIPLFIVLFGITLESKVYFVASAIFIIVFHSVNSGLKTTDRLLVQNLDVLGASRRSKIRHLYFPTVVSWLVAGLRFSVAWALLAAVISEYLGATQGLGYLISQGEAYFRTTDVIAGILVVAFIALIFDRLLVAAQKYFSRWQVA